MFIECTEAMYAAFKRVMYGPKSENETLKDCTKNAIEAAISVLDPSEIGYSSSEEIKRLQDEIAGLEALRPHWAKGYSSASVAAQVQTTALNEIWKHLGVSNQTACMDKLRSYSVLDQAIADAANNMDLATNLSKENEELRAKLAERDWEWQP